MIKASEIMSDFIHYEAFQILFPPLGLLQNAQLDIKQFFKLESLAGAYIQGIIIFGKMYG